MVRSRRGLMYVAGFSLLMLFPSVFTLAQENWEQVVGGATGGGNGFGDVDNYGAFAMTAFDGFLWSGTNNSATGWCHDHRHHQVWAWFGNDSQLQHSGPRFGVLRDDSSERQGSSAVGHGPPRANGSLQLPTLVRLVNVAPFQALKSTYKKLSRIDPLNDGMMLFDDQIIPGSSFIACLNADHWAVSVPIARTHPKFAATFVDNNDYPREALLEALLRFVEEQLSEAPE